MTDKEADLRRDLVQTCRDMQAKGLSKGTSGNVSVRSGDGFLISPTGIPYEDLHPDQVVPMVRSCRPANGGSMPMSCERATI